MEKIKRLLHNKKGFEILESGNIKSRNGNRLSVLSNSNKGILVESKKLILLSMEGWSYGE